jgi:hypothetical protein
MQLRQLLLGAKLCEERVLAEAAAQAEADGSSTLAELVRRGSLDCDRLAVLLSEKTKLPILTPEELVTDEEAIRTLPFDAALDDEAKREIEKVSGFRCEVLLARGTDLEAAIGRAYASLITRSIPRRTPYAVTALGKAVEPSTRPTHEDPSVRLVERRLLALVELLVEKGVLTQAELDERLKKSE